MGIVRQIHRGGLWAEKAAYAALDLTGLLPVLDRLVPKSPTVLSFHSVQPAFTFGNSWFTVSHPVEEFEQIIEFLCRHYEIVPLTRIVSHVASAGGHSGREIALTFDDGYEDNYLYVKPILAARGLPWTVFVTAGVVEAGEALWTVHLADVLNRAPHRKISVTLWDKAGQERRFVLDMSSPRDRQTAMGNLSGFLVTLPFAIIRRNVEILAETLRCRSASEDGRRLRLLTWEQIRELAESGVDIGSHGMYHLAMECQNDLTLREEIEGSKRLLEERLGVPISHFCYPFGTPGFYGPRSRALVKEAGYEAAFLNIRGALAAGGDPFQMTRLSCPIGEKVRLKGRLAGIVSRIYVSALASGIRQKA